MQHVQSVIMHSLAKISLLSMRMCKLNCIKEMAQNYKCIYSRLVTSIMSAHSMIAVALLAIGEFNMIFIAI